MRWHFHWGRTVTGPNGPIDITEYEYAEAFGDPIPEEPEVPDEGMSAWLAFWKLNRRRGPAFSGVAAISYTEIRNWSELTRTFITPEDVEFITTIDDAFREAIGEGEERKRQRQESRDKAEQKLGKR